MPAHPMPTLNATLNGLAAVLLLAGWIAIKKGRPDLHRKLMMATMAVSALFLACYLYYHFTVKLVTRYPGDGWDRTLYLLILGTHSLLAPWILPFSIAAVWHALKGRLDKHVRITRWLWPIWMYVSITGVVVYLMLYHL